MLIYHRRGFCSHARLMFTWIIKISIPSCVCDLHIWENSHLERDNELNKSDATRRNTLGCLDQYTVINNLIALIRSLFVLTLTMKRNNQKSASPVHCTYPISSLHRRPIMRMGCLGVHHLNGRLRWLSARLWYFQCFNAGDITVSHWAIYRNHRYLSRIPTQHHCWCSLSAGLGRLRLLSSVRWSHNLHQTSVSHSRTGFESWIRWCHSHQPLRDTDLTAVCTWHGWCGCYHVTFEEQWSTGRKARLYNYILYISKADER